MSYNPLPSQATNSGKVLSTDGVQASWIDKSVMTDYVYFGSPTVDGSTRTGKNGIGDTVVEIRRSGSWEELINFGR